MRGKYNTKQRVSVLAYLEEHKDECFTVKELTSAIGDVGETTVYRCLSLLSEEGEVKKYISSKGECASYQYFGEGAEIHIHLKCTECGGVYHSDCELLRAVWKHISSDHGFEPDMSKTVLYGVCAECKKKNREHTNI